jgi:hypothetical protein
LLTRIGHCSWKVFKPSGTFKGEKKGRKEGGREGGITNYSSLHESRLKIKRLFSTGSVH